MIKRTIYSVFSRSISNFNFEQISIKLGLHCVRIVDETSIVYNLSIRLNNKTLNPQLKIVLKYFPSRHHFRIFNEHSFLICSPTK